MSRKKSNTEQTEEERLLATLNGEGDKSKGDQSKGDQSKGDEPEGDQSKGDEPEGDQSQAPAGDEPKPAPHADGSNEVPAVVKNIGKNPRRIGRETVAPGGTRKLTDQERSNPRLMAKIRHAMRTGFLTAAK